MKKSEAERKQIEEDLKHGEIVSIEKMKKARKPVNIDERKENRDWLKTRTSRKARTETRTTAILEKSEMA